MVTKKLSDEQVMKNVETVEKLLTAKCGSKAQDIMKMFEKLEYYMAPASAREDHHSCFPGGLCYHSLKVTANVLKITKAMAPGRWTDNQLIFVGLVHDLGKCGDGEHQYYLPNPSDWHRSKGMLYEYNKACPYMPVQERSLFLLQKFGFALSAEDYLAIRLHDGAYPDENKPYAMKEPDLAIMLHWADRWSTAEEKKEFGVTESVPE